MIVSNNSEDDKCCDNNTNDKTKITILKNNNNNKSINELEYIRNTIESMNNFNQIEILKIICNFNTECINENSNGIYINLSDLSIDIIDKLEEYINYVITQENHINSVEQQKQNYIETYFQNTT